jgi:hypothetical protein
VPGTEEVTAVTIGRRHGIEQLPEWVHAGLLSPEQADRIREHEADRPQPAQRHTASLVTEGLGYVGGALVLVAALTIADRYWGELGSAARIALVLGASVLLVVAGAVVAAPARSAGYRLRAVTWALAVVATGGWLALLAEQVLGTDDERTVLCAAGGAALLAAALWWRHRTALQQAVFVAAITVAVGTAASLLPADDGTLVGLALWGWGTAWLLVGAGRLLAGGTSGRTAADICGGAVAILGALLTVDADLGTVLAIATSALLVVGGVVARDLVLLGVGAVATLVLVPTVVGQWFPGTLVAPMALLVVGAFLVVAALLVARRRKAGLRPDEAATYRSLDPRVAGAVAATVVLAGAAVVLGLGLG